MKMEKTAREILVTLSVADQQAFGVRYDTMSFSDPRTRRFCEQLAVLVCLREGIEETGNVTLRAAENPAGELLLYFSFPRQIDRGLYSGVIEFFGLDGLLDSRRALLRDPSLCAEVYRYDGRYFLWYEFDTSPRRFAELTALLLEYGTLSSFDRAFLTEHAIPLPCAVPLLLN